MALRSVGRWPLVGRRSLVNIQLIFRSARRLIMKTWKGKACIMVLSLSGGLDLSVSHMWNWNKTTLKCFRFVLELFQVYSHGEKICKSWNSFGTTANQNSRAGFAGMLYVENYHRITRNCRNRSKNIFIVFRHMLTLSYTLDFYRAMLAQSAVMRQ